MGLVDLQKDLVAVGVSARREVEKVRDAGACSPVVLDRTEEVLSGAERTAAGGSGASIDRGMAAVGKVLEGTRRALGDGDCSGLYDLGS